jgi:hypothetical protein
MSSTCEKEKNMQFIKRLMLTVVVVVLVSGFIGCKKKDAGEKAGAAVGKAVQNAGQSVEKAGKEVQKSAQ